MHEQLRRAGDRLWIFIVENAEVVFVDHEPQYICSMAKVFEFLMRPSVHIPVLVRSKFRLWSVACAEDRVGAKFFMAVPVAKGDVSILSDVIKQLACLQAVACGIIARGERNEEMFSYIKD
jgi:hypothetical protein